MVRQAEGIVRALGEILGSIGRGLIDFASIDLSEMGFDDQTTAAIKVALDLILNTRVDVVPMCLESWADGIRTHRPRTVLNSRAKLHREVC